MSSRQNVTSELIEEGLLTVRQAEDGKPEYALTGKGVELAKDLLATSSRAREYLRTLRARETTGRTR